tara:strand:+ start:96 stop:371 length:276 start_codon:yes stop_codon:yes gene_type:complete
MDLHKAIRAIHSTVVVIDGDTEKTIVATDKDNKEVTIDWTKVNAWKDPNEYQYKRENEYPRIEEQLDDMYHNGFDKWKATIKKIKDKYPKE